MRIQKHLLTVSVGIIYICASGNTSAEVADGLAVGLPTDVISQSQSADESTVFGEQLFQGNFASTYGSTFTGDYKIQVGDAIQVRMWGAYEYGATVTVDSNGYINLPNMAPLPLLNVKNSQLNKTVSRAVKNTYRSKVGVYAALEAAQPVKVFVTGFVNAPGYYAGVASDSVLAYLDRAGGIDADRGSYIDVQIKRQGKLVQQVNLYDFLLAGQLPSFIFKEGDIVSVTQTKNTFTVGGAVRNNYTFEYSVPDLTVADVLTIANPIAEATYINITNPSSKEAPDPYRLSEAMDITINNGDHIFVIGVQ